MKHFKIQRETIVKDNEDLNIDDNEVPIIENFCDGKVFWGAITEEEKRIMNYDSDSEPETPFLVTPKSKLNLNRQPSSKLSCSKRRSIIKLRKNKRLSIKNQLKMYRIPSTMHWNIENLAASTPK